MNGAWHVECKDTDRQGRTRASNYRTLGVSLGRGERRWTEGQRSGLEEGLSWKLDWGERRRGRDSESGRAPFGLWDGLWSLVSGRATAAAQSSRVVEDALVLFSGDAPGSAGKSNATAQHWFASSGRGCGRMHSQRNGGPAKAVAQ